MGVPGHIATEVVVDGRLVVAILESPVVIIVDEGFPVVVLVGLVVAAVEATAAVLILLVVLVANLLTKLNVAGRSLSLLPNFKYVSSCAIWKID